MSEQREPSTVFRDLPKRRSGPGNALKWLAVLLFFLALLGFGVIALLHLNSQKNGGVPLVERNSPETTVNPDVVANPEPAPAPIVEPVGSVGSSTSQPVPSTPGAAPIPTVPAVPAVPTVPTTVPAPSTVAATTSTSATTPTATTTPTTPAASPPAAAEPPAPPPPEPEDPALRETYKKAMEKVLGQMMKKQRALETMQAQEWGGQAYSNALATVKIGDTAWQDSRYKAASQAYGDALRQFEDVERLKQAEFTTFMQRGQAALDAGKGEAAQEAFNAAVAINPDDPAAQKGAERAKTIERVYGLLASGEEKEATGRIAYAQADYTIAKTLDPEFTPAVEALARVEKMVVENKFNVAMAEGISAFEKGDYDGAKTIIESARAFDPANPQIADTLEMIEQGIMANKLGEVRRKADEALASEDFDTAIDLYNQALALKPQVAFARDGAKRASDALALWQDVDRYLLELTRINNRNGLANATELANKAAAFPSPGPQLGAKINRLRGMVAGANAQIPVTITSDGFTSVDVYRVGRFGAIRSKTFNARPGSYTAMGKREGYRDVRVVFEVKNGAPAPRVDVRCTQSIR